MTKSIDPNKVKAGDTVTVEVGQPNGNTYSVTGNANRTSPNGYLWVGPIRIDAGAIEAYPARITDHQPAPAPEWKPGTAGTATVRGHEGIRGMWVRHAFPASHDRAFVSDDGVSSRPDYVTAFVPDDAEALRAELIETREAYQEWKKSGKAMNTALLDIWHMVTPWDTKHLTYGEDPETVFQSVKAEVERLRAARTLPTREQRGQLVDLLIAFSNNRADEWDTADKILALVEQGGAAPDAEDCPDDGTCVEHCTEEP